MSFWSGEKLGENLGELITPFDARQIDCAAYRLRVGPEVYISPSEDDDDAKTRTKVQLAAGQSFPIPPGQFAFLLTEERVSVPKNALAFISVRATVKFGGLVNVSGFHVAYSDDCSHRFRSKPATCSDRSQPGIPMIPAG